MAAGDVNRDGTSDIVTGIGANFSHVKIFAGTNLNLLGTYIAYQGATLEDGINVAAVDKICLTDVAPAPFGDGTVSVPDLLMIINNWGSCGGQYCPSDIAPSNGPIGDGAVNVQDMLVVINVWGLCP